MSEPMNRTVLCSTGAAESSVVTNVEVRYCNTVASAEQDTRQLKPLVFYWLCQNPGKDAEDVSDEFEISGAEAIRVTEELLNEGILAFA